jgi:hypothetical protein
MFLRESEGVYQFGQKRVYIKIEKGNHILVRVGGGYMSIDQFIKQYTQEEVEKINRKHVVQKYEDKTLIQNIAAHLPVHSREKSPIRSPVRASSQPKSPIKMNQKLINYPGSGKFIKFN